MRHPMKPVLWPISASFSTERRSPDLRSAPNAGPAGRMQGVIDVRIELHNGPLDAPDCRLRDYCCELLGLSLQHETFPGDSAGSQCASTPLFSRLRVHRNCASALIAD